MSEQNNVNNSDDTGDQNKDKNQEHLIPKSRLDAEIGKRKEAENELKTIAENLKADIPEDFQDLVPDLPPGKLIAWIRSANVKGLFASKTKDSIDSKRPSEKKPKDLDSLSPQQKMAQGYKK